MQAFKVQALAQFGSLPAGVDLIVMRQEKMSAAKVAATAAKVSAAGTAPFASPLEAASPIPSVPLRTILPALSSAAAISSIDYANIIHELQGAVKVEAVASMSYYRDMAFAAALCDEFGVIEAADGLAYTDVEKFNGLAEELTYEDADSFKKKLQTIRENYFTNKSTNTLVESVVTDSPVITEEYKAVDPTMKSYLSVLNSIKK